MKRMQIHNSEIIANYIFGNIQQLVWDGVAEKNIQRMAPQSTNIQCMWTLHSFVRMVGLQQQNPTTLIQQIQPQKTSIDVLAIGHVQSQAIENCNKSIYNMSEVRKKSQTNSSMKWTTSRNFLMQKQEQMEKKRKNSNSAFFTKLPEQVIQVNKKQTQLRHNYTIEQEHNKKMQQQIKERESKRNQQSLRSQKILKELKKYTFDYQGSLFGIPTNTNDKPSSLNKLKSQFSGINISQKQSSSPIIQNLQNQKMTLRQAKMKKQKVKDPIVVFNQEGPKTILQTFDGNQQTISEGVKISESVNNQKISKQNAKKTLTGFRKYRLNEFKQFSKEKKFTQHKYMSSKKNTMKSSTILYDPQIKQKGSDFSLNVSEKDDRQVSGYGVLPPLKNGIRSKSMFRGSQKSFDLSKISKKQQSKIIVDNDELFSENFITPYGSRATIQFQ